MDEAECKHFKTVTIRNLAKRAQSLKSLRPPRGLSFSLQQQRKLLIFSVLVINLSLQFLIYIKHFCFSFPADKLKLNYNFIASLLANAFFSTFPKRTEKTHPTLQDFNFTYFFKNLHL